MLGRSHMVSGTAVFTGTTLALNYTVSQVITGLVVVSCAALLPDMDHNKATISRVYGPVTVGFSHVVAALAGGHRKGTHSFLGILLLGVIAQVCVTHRDSYVAKTVLSCLLIVTLAAGLKILVPQRKKRRKRKRPGEIQSQSPFSMLSWVDEFIPIPLVVALVFLTPVNLDAVPPAIMMGCLVHVFGDCLTNTGCPVLWPFSKWRLKFGLFSTGKWFERRVVFPVMIVGTFAMACLRVFHGTV